MSQAGEDLPREVWRTVSIVRLKQFVADRLPLDWVLRDAILNERDSLTLSDFCAKLQIWLHLLRRAGDATP
jgi:hypothetical protein